MSTQGLRRTTPLDVAVMKLFKTHVNQKKKKIITTVGSRNIEQKYFIIL